VLIAVICISVFFYNAEDLSNDVEHTVAQDIFHNVKIQEKEKTHNEIIGPSLSVVDEEIQPESEGKRPPLPLSGQHRDDYDAALATIEKNMADIGYFYEDELNVYSAYSSDLLFSLVKAGDLLAIQVLAARTLESGDYESARLLYIDAATRGSIEAINWLSHIPIAAGEKSGTSSDPVAAMRHLIESSAWTMLLEKRDFYDIWLHPDPINPISLSLQERMDMNAVNALADEYYNLMTAKRHEWGLGAFDNQPVADYVNSMNKIYELGAIYTLPFDESDIEESNPTDQ